MRAFVASTAVRARFVVVVICGCLLAGSAHADVGIVLESYTGQRPEDGNRLLSPVLDELTMHGFVTGADVVGRKFEAQVSRPALASEGFPADFADQVEKGHKSWIAGQFDQAVAILAPLVDAAHASPGAFAQTKTLRERLLKAEIALAISQFRLGDPNGARQTFAEIVRSFPETTQLSRASYGADAFNQFEQVRKELTAGGRGRLKVTVNSDSAVIFINENYENVGATTKGDLAPGEYRVFAVAGKLISRSHRVIVKANEEAQVMIDVGFDVAIHSSPRWSGLSFASSGDREKLEASYAAAFANAVDAHAVAVVGIDQVHGRPAIIGALINLTNGRELRRASLQLDPDPPVERLRALARFLAGEDAVSGIDVMIAGDHGGDAAPLGPDPAGRSDRPSDRGHWGGWKWITGIATLGALGGGGALLVLDGTCSTKMTGNVCPNLYNTAVPGWIGVGAGVVLGALTIYLFTHSGRPSSSGRAAYVVPTVGGAVAGVEASF